MRAWSHIFKEVSSMVVYIFALMAILSTAANSYEGRVVEKDTNNAIDGAFVVAAWRGSLIAPPEQVSVCHHVEMAITDKEGRFSFSDWSGNINPLIVNRRMELEVFYKAGYYWDLSKPFPIVNNTFVLTPHSGTPEQRFDQIKVRIPIECGYEEGPKKLVPLMRAIYAEAKGAALTDKQMQSAERWLEMSDRYEFDNSIAAKNKQMRQIERKKGELSK